MTKPYSYCLETLPPSEDPLSASFGGHTPFYIYRYWADGEAEWISSPGQDGESVLSERGVSPWENMHALEIFAADAGTGVWVGYVAYELGALAVLERPATHTPSVPLIHLAYYPLLGAHVPREFPSFTARSPKPHARRARLTPEPAQDRDAWIRAVQAIQAYLKSGDCYQVNHTQAFHARTSLSATTLYERLRRLNPAPFAAFLDCGEFQILSASPERFLKIDARTILTEPIKGTIGRGENRENDHIQRERLLASAKDGAELLMICDLERNDLGRVCVPGSVRVDALKEIKTFPTLHHLVSRISGTLLPNTTHTMALRACFPGGSITGAPKKRAMEIIERLEPHARGVYTGCIGYFGKAEGGRAKSQWNIAIRTLTYQDGLVSFASGGGITVDSDPALEYEESLLKAKALWQALDG